MSLANCLRKFGKTFPTPEKIALHTSVRNFVEAGMSRAEAEIAAVDAALAEAVADYQEVLAAVYAELPALKPKAAQKTGPARAVLPETQSIELTGQTEAEIRADEKRRADKAKRKANEEAAAEAKAKADADVGGFTLTGSDRQADVGAAMFSRGGNTQFAQDVLSELAANDELFRYPVSSASTLDGVMEDVDPTIRYLGDVTRVDEKTESGADRRHMFRTQKGRDIYIYERGKDVWLDVSRLEEGEGGSGIYAAVLNYAHNAGRVLVGDPAGLSEAAVIRRTSAMLSSALRFGTTKHMDAAPEQVKGNPEKGIAPLDWRGDDVAKVSALIDTFVSTLQARFPRIKNARYDFTKRQFLGRDGVPIDRAGFQRLADQGVGREAKAGSATLRRGIFLESLLRSGSSQRPGILEQVLRRSRELVNEGGLDRLFSRTQAPARGLSVSSLRSTIQPIRKRWANPPEVVYLQSMDEAPTEARRADAEARSQGATGQPEGFWWRGKVYLVANGINTPERAITVLMHESLGHYGLRGVFGAQLTPILKQIATMRRAEVAIKARQYGLDMGKEADRLMAAEEVLAELAQTRPEIGFVKRAIAAIRQFLREIGIDLKLSDNDIIANFILPARRFVEQGGKAPEGVQMFGQPAYMVAYHGSPYDFDRFSTQKIGTGEGAQAYGWGLYFAGKKEIADFYKKKLSDPGRELDRLTGTKDGRTLTGIEFLPEYFKPGRVVKGYGGFDEVISFNPSQDYRWSVTVREVKTQFGGKPNYYDARPRTHSTQPDATEVRKALEAEGWKFPSGKLYQVDLAPAEDQYLLWEKPLSTQPKTLQADLKSGNHRMIAEAVARDWQGRKLYQKLAEDLGSQEYASRYLNSLGIPGIKYLDGASRGKGSGSYNYVIFDDSLVKVEAKFSRGRIEPSPKFRAAIDTLMQDRAGEVDAALFNPSIGPIDLVYGVPGTKEKNYEDGYGLAHILAKHPEIDPYQLENIVASARVINRRFNTIIMDDGIHDAVIKLDWKGTEKKWLLTAYERKQSAAASEMIGVTDRAESAPLADQEADRSENTTPGGSGSQDGPQAMFSRADPEGPQSTGAQTVREKLLQRFKDFTDAGALAADEGVLNAWNKSVGTPELVARKNESFAKVFWEGQAYLNDINHNISESEALLPSWFKGQDILSRWFDRVRGKEVAKAEKAAEALLDGTLSNTVFNEAQLRKRGLSDREIAMYEEARTAVDSILENTGAALISKIAPQYADVALRLIQIYKDSGIEGIEDFTDYSAGVGQSNLNRLQEDLAAARSDDLRKSLTARIESERLRLEEWSIVTKSISRIDTLQKDGYFPLSRFGRFYVNVTDPMGETVEFRMYESETMAKVGAAQMSKKYPKAYQVQRGTVSQDTPDLFKGLTPESVELFAQITGMDEDESMQRYLKEAVANRSTLKRMIHRKGTPGYSKDAVRVLADFISSNARYMSRLKHFENLTQYAHDIKGGELRDYAIQLVKYLRGDDGREDFQKTRAFLFFQYIGGNISSALLNVSQVPMFTAPWLSQHTSMPNVGRLLKRGYQMAVMDPGSVAGKLGEALRLAEADGITNQQNVYTMMAVGAGSKLARIRAFSGFLDAWAFLFSKAEILNRRVTFIAAYELAQSRNMKDQEAYDFAAQAVRDTQFIYNKGNRPPWARGIGAVPFTFKLFTIQALESIFSKMPPRQAAMILALMFLAAGAEGLPFAEDLQDLVDTLGQKLGYATNSKRWVQESLQAGFQEWMGLPQHTAFMAAEMVRKGVFANTALATMGARVGMGNLLPGTAALQTGRDAGGEIMEAAGPIAGFARNVTQGAELLARGDTSRAAEKALPSGVANIIKGARQIEFGKEISPFGRKIADVPATEAVAQMVGIYPATVARARDREFIVKQDELYLKTIEDRIADKWAAGVVDQDPEKVREAIRDLREFNQRNPGSKILITPRQIQMRVRNLRREGVDAVVRGVARERRAQARQFLTEETP